MNVEVESEFLPGRGKRAWNVLQLIDRLAQVGVDVEVLFQELLKTADNENVMPLGVFGHVR